MLEHNDIPRAIRYFYVIPLDNPVKDPKQRSNKRPIALLSPLITMLRRLLVRRKLPKEKDRLSTYQYAYQKARRTGLLLLDLDRLVQESRKKERMVNVAGSDIAGPSDRASHLKLVKH